MNVFCIGRWTQPVTASIFCSPPRRAAAAAKRFFQKALSSPKHPTPRVINVDRNPSYPAVIEALKSEETLQRRCRLRPVQYLNNVLEQDHRAIKRRVRASQGFRSFWGAYRTIQGYEAVHAIRKGQVRWVASVRLFANSISSRGCSRLQSELTPTSCLSLCRCLKVATLPFF